MKVFSHVHKYEFSWEMVSQALWLKYPNPLATHVLASDILSRTIDSDGILHTVRLLLKTSSVPSWGKSLINAPEALIVERSSIDPVNRIMTVQTGNISYAGLIRVVEDQTYQCDPDNLHWTIVKTNATFTSKIRWGLRQTLESFSYSRFKENLLKSTQGIQLILEKFFAPRTQPST
ncbi:hypothetical protein MDAP_000389 [Mitosporidium daphniae]